MSLQSLVLYVTIADHMTQVLQLTNLNNYGARPFYKYKTVTRVSCT